VAVIPEVLMYFIEGSCTAFTYQTHISSTCRTSHINSTQFYWRTDKNDHWHRHKINTN